MLPVLQYTGGRIDDYYVNGYLIIQVNPDSLQPVSKVGRACPLLSFMGDKGEDGLCIHLFKAEPISSKPAGKSSQVTVLGFD